MRPALLIGRTYWSRPPVAKQANQRRNLAVDTGTGEAPMAAKTLSSMRGQPFDGRAFVGRSDVVDAMDL